MTTMFDAIPLTFSEDTVDVIVTKYMELQNVGDAFITAPDLTNLNRADIIHTLLVSIADNPTNDYSPNDIAKLAAYAAAWVESLMTNG